MVVAPDGLEGEGPFSNNREGTLPVGKVIKMCYSGKNNLEEMIRHINGEAGLMGYLGTTDLRRIIQNIEEGDKWNSTLKTHIINYSKTRAVYEEYRRSGYSKKFLEEHRTEITLHKAAKTAFDELGVKKIPKVKELSVEYAEVLKAKKQMYAEYRQVKNEAQEYVIAQRNIESLYEAERKEEEQKQQRNQNQQH